jgi:UDP-N-acetylglucosamine 2-epimerase (non-hydrolysing)
MALTKKILFVFGTRPEAIKMAPLVKEFQKHPEQFETLVCVTAQHRQMLDQVLHLFEITPDYDLNIMKEGQDLYDVTSGVLMGMRDVLKKSKPDAVLVHGDTSTSTAAALAAFYQQIPVGHVEAGLRTHNIYSPWPEEMNRQITSRIATYNFAPTQLSKQNLLQENIPEKSIHVTGNTVIDALYWVIYKMKNNNSLDQWISNILIDFGLPTYKLAAWRNQCNPVKPENQRKLILITGHRRENFGQGFINICEAIRDLSISFPEVDFVYPMHLNPNVRNAITQVFGETVICSITKQSVKDNANMYFIEPLDYLPFIYLMNLSYLILTDSGGIQEEAPALGKPVLVMRDTTERPEALNAGTVRIIGTDKQRIINEISCLIEISEQYNFMSKATNPYGDGTACNRIIDAINSK